MDVPEPTGLLDVSASQAASAIRAELTRLRHGIERIEEQLDALEREQRPPAVLRERPERYLRTLVDVYEHGGRTGLDADAFGAIGHTHGYDRRGLGGFFTGARAPLRRRDGRVLLTPHGEHLIDVYLARLEP